MTNWTLFVSSVGSQHSGAYEDDFNASSNDLDSNQPDSTADNSKQYEEEDDDTDGIDVRCNVCDRKCSDIDQWVIENRVWFIFLLFFRFFINSLWSIFDWQSVWKLINYLHIKWHFGNVLWFRLLERVSFKKLLIIWLSEWKVIDTKARHINITHSNN